MESLMYPAYQKYYSALCNLKRFSVENNFFDNISCLDNFFSEYRSVTLVLQKSIAHTAYKQVYDELSKDIWDKFFNEQRVKSIHIHPVEFKKKITITIYKPYDCSVFLSKEYTIDNDIILKDLFKTIKQEFDGFKMNEIFFSAKFLFLEKETNVDIWDKIIDGLSTMKNFMDKMYSKINQDCELCEHLRKEISKMEFSNFTKEFMLIQDYVYYSKKNSFERSKINMLATYPPETKFNLDNIKKSSELFHGRTIFQKFILLNVLLKTTDLMPTIMTVFNDNSYKISMFQSDIKTTLYRKINNVAEEIKDNQIKEVYVMCTYVAVNYEKDIEYLTSKEREDKGINEYLTFMKIDHYLNEEEYVFDGKFIENDEYILKQLRSKKHNKLNFGYRNMLPIIKAFENLTK